jgi:hypothetical protein
MAEGISSASWARPSMPSTKTMSWGSRPAHSVMKVRRSSGMAVSILMRTTEPRRRCFKLLELADQVLGLFLDLDVAVADQAEHARASTSQPGNRWSMNIISRLSSAMNRCSPLRRAADSAAGPEARTWVGTGTRA